jgi:hypothetical protein
MMKRSPVRSLRMRCNEQIDAGMEISEVFGNSGTSTGWMEDEEEGDSEGDFGEVIASVEKEVRRR